MSRAKPLFTVIMASVVTLAGCDADSASGLPDDGEGIGLSMAMGLWSPSKTDTCSREIHDSYRTVGPDGLWYPTWHPPVDPATGCHFGHEHGRNPAGSNLTADVGAIPFGYANEHLLASGFGASRAEDHFGHKVEWENNIEMRIGEGGGAAVSIRCDVLTKLHQGTHSPDAFTNNLHELVYHIRCTDGTGFSMTLLTPIGHPGEMVVGCDRDRHIAVGTANPPNSPDGGGKRALPEAACVVDRILNPGDGRPRFDSALRESWEVSASIRREGGRVLASINPYFQVMDPSRYFDAALDRSMGRPIDLCGALTTERRDRCENVVTAVTWDDPASPFKGVRRFVDINSNRVRNADGPSVWYTDPLGRNGKTEPFTGSIRQWIAQRDNSGLDIHGPVIGRERSYDAPGVRAPN